MSSNENSKPGPDFDAGAEDSETGLHLYSAVQNKTMEECTVSDAAPVNDDKCTVPDPLPEEECPVQNLINEDEGAGRDPLPEEERLAPHTLNDPLKEDGDTGLEAAPLPEDECPASDPPLAAEGSDEDRVEVLAVIPAKKRNLTKTEAGEVSVTV
ncbi:hypothetical protein MRX96_013490 [Rhipicephalus microplus]